MLNKKNNLTLGSLGERGFLRRFLPDLVRFSPNRFHVPPGDDAAVLKARFKTVLSIDGLTEGTHFKYSWAATCQKIFNVSLGRALGWKLLGSALSDLAAMGASSQRWAMIYLGAPSTIPVDFLKEFHRGLKESARRYECALAGGDTVRAKDLTLVAAVGGVCPSKRILVRSTAKPGDLLCIAGLVGDASTGLDVLRNKSKFGKREKAYFVRRFFEVEPLLNEGKLLANEAGVSSLIDLSDSLAESAVLLSRSSNVGIEVIIDNIPVSVQYKKVRSVAPALLSGGEDYSLFFTLRPAALGRLKSKLSFAVVGRVVESAKGIRYFWKGRLIPMLGFYQHFRNN